MNTGLGITGKEWEEIARHPAVKRTFPTVPLLPRYLPAVVYGAKFVLTLSKPEIILYTLVYTEKTGSAVLMLERRDGIIREVW